MPNTCPRAPAVPSGLPEITIPPFDFSALEKTQTPATLARLRARIEKDEPVRLYAGAWWRGAGC